MKDAGEASEAKEQDAETKWAWDMGGRETQRKEPSSRAASESGPVQSLQGQGVGGRGAWVYRDVDGAYRSIFFGALHCEKLVP